MIEKATLLAGYLPSRDVPLPSGGGTVKVRGLTRHEAVELQRAAGEDVAELEIGACAAGMLEPKLTQDEVRAWRLATIAADVQAVAGAISELSNLDEQAGKGPTSHSRRTKG